MLTISRLMPLIVTQTDSSASTADLPTLVPLSHSRVTPSLGQSDRGSSRETHNSPRRVQDRRCTSSGSIDDFTARTPLWQLVKEDRLGANGSCTLIRHTLTGCTMESYATSPKCPPRCRRLTQFFQIDLVSVESYQAFPPTQKAALFGQPLWRRSRKPPIYSAPIAHIAVKESGRRIEQSDR